MSTALTALTLQDLIYDTRLLIGDSGDIANTYADKDVTTAINYAIQQYCRFTGCNYVETTFAITNGATTNSFPFDYLMIQRVGYDTKWLLPTSINDEYIKNPSWDTVTGTPIRWMMFSGSKIKITPYPVSNATPIKVGFIKSPQLLSVLADAVDSTIPYSDHKYLKYAAVSFLLSIDSDKSDIEKGNFFMEQFKALIQKG
jgi:hypothetical protein